MTEEMLEALAALNQVKPARDAIQVERPVHSPGHEMAVPERLNGTDAVFSQEDREASVVAGWLGMWAGTLLLKDIIKDTVTPPVDDEREENGKPRPKHRERDCC